MKQKAVIHSLSDFGSISMKYSITGEITIQNVSFVLELEKFYFVFYAQTAELFVKRVPKKRLEYIKFSETPTRKEIECFYFEGKRKYLPLVEIDITNAFGIKKKFIFCFVVCVFDAFIITRGNTSKYEIHYVYKKLKFIKANKSKEQITCIYFTQINE